MSNQQIRVMIVDDHEMVRRGLGLFIRGYDDLHLIGEATNGAEAIALCETLQPDVILMDVIMPNTDGIQATRVIKQKYPHIQVITLSSSSDTDNVMAMIQAGAVSYLLKNVADDELANAIRTAKQGQRVMSPEATQALINAATRPPQPAYQFSAREMQVLTLLVKGLNNPDIADQLFLSRSTIKYHINSIFSKLGVRNRSEAIAVAVKNRLV